MSIGHMALSTALCGLAGCITVPPEQPPPETARKATVVVDSRGKRIEGGYLIVDIPAAALREDERITVTIDEILGAPAGHLKDAYLVGPADQAFDLPIDVSYRYNERWLEDVVDPEALFVGVAQGNGWEPLKAREHDADARLFRGEVTHFSTFGLIDPSVLIATDAGLADATRTDRVGTDLRQQDSGRLDAGLADQASHDHAPLDAGHSDSGLTDSGSIDSGLVDQGSTDLVGTPPDISIQLTWDHPTADLDIHLLRREGGEFSNDDCYYADCKSGNGLDWGPAGAAGNPVLVIDDVNGYGPEEIAAETLEDGSYIVGVHYYQPNGNDGPTTYTVSVFSRGSLLLQTSTVLPGCKQLDYAVDLVISQSGVSVTASARSDPPFLTTQGVCL